MKKVILLTLLAGSISLGTTAVNANDSSSNMTNQSYSAQDDTKKKGKRAAKNRTVKIGKSVIKKLKLTKEQKAQFKTFRQTQKEPNKALRKETKALRAEIKALDSTSADYQTNLSALKEKRAELNSRRKTLRSTANENFKSVLTEEQLAEFSKMRPKRKGKKRAKRLKKKNAE